MVVRVGGGTDGGVEGTMATLVAGGAEENVGGMAKDAGVVVGMTVVAEVPELDMADTRLLELVLP